MVKVYKISGMTCNGCADVVRNLMSKVDGIAKVDVDLSKSRAEVELEYDVPLEALQAAFSNSLYQISDDGPANQGNGDSLSIDETLERNKQIVAGYVSAVGKLEHHRLHHFIHPDFKYKGALSIESAADYIQMIKDHAKSPVANVLIENRIESIYPDENECCVIYETVTTFPGRTVPFVEWLRIEGNKIVSAEVKFNRHRMKQLMDEMNRKTAKSS